MVNHEAVLAGLYLIANACFVVASGLILGYVNRPGTPLLHPRAVLALVASLGAYTLATILGTLYGFAYSDAGLLLAATWLAAVSGAVLFLIATVLLARDFIHFRRQDRGFPGGVSGGFERAED
jgi:hypothetical protein